MIPTICTSSLYILRTVSEPTFTGQTTHPGPLCFAVRSAKEPDGVHTERPISKLGKKLGLRQRAIATATVFFRRFYLKNSYCETDPFIVIAACCYVAAKAEESPIHIKNIVAESRALFSQEQYNVKHFPSDHTKLAEMEFYLVDDLECDWKYPTLRRCLAQRREKQTRRVSAQCGRGPRYWGTGEGQLELSEGALQTAWFIINDTYRSDLCLLHPPHIIAIAALYLTFILNGPTRSAVLPSLPSASAPTPRRSTRQEQSKKPPPPPQDPIAFFAGSTCRYRSSRLCAGDYIAVHALGAIQGGRGKHGKVTALRRDGEPGEALGGGVVPGPLWRRWRMPVRQRVRVE
ncbi:putative cyclin family protein [Lyophyllum shimeji]|uniref:Cyclin family protein n=1 Tax=Lyophyllum shimeji TaxID=47721 RepID=A0A9P3Q2D6_LYOSH|nr:putative cyclin family protein [Lyophyllum shimeji]